MNNIPTPQGLHRSRHDRLLLGVCGGIAQYFDFPAWGVRLLMIFLTFMTGFILIIPYIMLGILMRPAPPPEFEQPAGNIHCPQPARRLPPDEAMLRIRQRCRDIDQRLQHLESVVTRSRFSMEDEFRKL